MSIQLLTQVYDEMRRLAIAGSVVAQGDFRLKKLIPPLELAGAKAPVFAKVAQAVTNVVNADAKISAAPLLELATLVNAILYTQGDTSAEGTIAPIETTEMGGTVSQASARMLKPLLEALSTTGSGRLEIIRDAHERDAFRDLRLVKPALAAIDDVYGEIADLIAEKVLPMYGKAILPELRSTLDIKGRAGHPRRLRLMHAIDPAGTRELVKQALDTGSKEVKVVAVECLGGEAEDLSYLIEQAAAKAQEVRQAALRALAAIDHDDAVAVLQKAAAGKDLHIAINALQACKSPKLLDYVIAEADREIAELRKAKDKKEVSKKTERIQGLLWGLATRQDAKTEGFILKVFGQVGELARIKGDPVSGSAIQPTVVELMHQGSPNLRKTLADSHGELGTDHLYACFHAARHVYPAAQVFDMYSPYLTARSDDKKKRAGAAPKTMTELLGGGGYYWRRHDDGEPPLDPRWLDVAVELKDLSLVRALIRPGHAGANKFLKETFDAVLKKAKSLDDCHEVVSAMVYGGHPEATDAFLAAFEKQKKDYYTYWFAHLIPELPKSALPRLEALVPTLGDRAADSVLDYIQQLRDKK
jgi:hypothetical protein